MLLYHGSNIAVKKPELRMPERKLDFGAGFYLTSSLQQATRWAELKTARSGEGKAQISVYEVAEDIFNELRIRRFPRPNAQWLRYVIANRRGTAAPEKADVVIGPVANDQTMPTLALYIAGELTVAETLRRLRPQKLQDQYAFKTANALAGLSFQEARKA